MLRYSTFYIVCSRKEQKDHEDHLHERRRRTAVESRVHHAGNPQTGAPVEPAHGQRRDASGSHV